MTFYFNIIIRNDSIHLRFFANLVRRPHDSFWRPKIEADSILKFNISLIAFDFNLAKKRIYMFFIIPTKETLGFQPGK